MAIALSINVNKIALIRNSRPGNHPDLLAYSRQCIKAGVNGITVHPRPDQRHIRPEDCYQLKALVTEMAAHNPSPTGLPLEFNIEGNPLAKAKPALRDDFNDYPGFMQILQQARPDQATLVPDSNQQLTSDHGFDLSGNTSELQAMISDIQQLGSRVSLFMDPDHEQISRARDIGADRIELYTGPFAEQYAASNSSQSLFEQHCSAAEHAHAIGLGINAGHDLNLDNLQLYKKLPHLQEVSIGHALAIDALEVGTQNAIRHYLEVLA